MMRTDSKPTQTNSDKIASLRGTTVAEAISFWKETQQECGNDLSTNDVLSLLLARRDDAGYATPSELSSAYHDARTARRQQSIIPSVTETKGEAPLDSHSVSSKPSCFEHSRSRLSPSEDVIEAEFEKLVEDMRSQGFTKARQLSNYITSNQLGRQYPNICGVVPFREGQREWDYEGGFPIDIYARVCQALGLTDQGTNARAVGFTSYKQIDENRKNLP